MSVSIIKFKNGKINSLAAKAKNEKAQILDGSGRGELPIADCRLEPRRLAFGFGNGPA
jgi:hypothetical protein